MKKIPALSLAAVISVMFFSIHVTASGLDITGVDNFAILAGTYTNPGTGTIIIGDLGYIVPPSNPPAVTGATFVSPDATYAAAQATLSDLISQAQSETCTVSLGATDLAALAQPLTPNVYCFSGAVSIGAAGITLDGNGDYIFRINGALDTAADSHISLTGSAKTNDVFWVPVGTTTLGDNSVFVGNVLTTVSTTLGSTVSVNGRILSSDTVTTTGPDDIITATTCGLSPNPTSLDYGTISRDEQSTEKQLVLTNTGTIATSVQVQGDDWTGTDSIMHLEAGKTRYAFGSTGTPDPSGVAYASKTALTTTLAGNSVIASGNSNSTYWQLEASNMQNLPFSGTISQTITFTFSCLS